VSNDRPSSGSRWEPSPSSSADLPAPPADALHDAAALPTTALAADAPPSPRGRPRGVRVKLAAAAAGLLVLGGLGGYWLGHTTAASAEAGAGPGIGAHPHRERGGPGRDMQGPGPQSPDGAASGPAAGGAPAGGTTSGSSAAGTGAAA